MMLTQTSQLEYEELCRLDVLGLADSPLNDQQAVYSEFKEQLIRSAQGWYETGLSCKGNRQLCRITRVGVYDGCELQQASCSEWSNRRIHDSIIREQKEQGIIESAHQPARGVKILHSPQTSGTGK